MVRPRRRRHRPFSSHSSPTNALRYGASSVLNTHSATRRLIPPFSAPFFLLPISLALRVAPSPQDEDKIIASFQPGEHNLKDGRHSGQNPRQHTFSPAATSSAFCPAHLDPGNIATAHLSMQGNTEGVWGAKECCSRTPPQTRVSAACRGKEPASSQRLAHVQLTSRQHLANTV